MENQQHVTPYQTFGEPDAMGQLGASIAATKKNQPQAQIQGDQAIPKPVQPPEPQPVPNNPSVQPVSIPQPVPNQPVIPPAQPVPAVPVPAAPVVPPVKPAPAVPPVKPVKTPEPYKAPVIDKIEGTDEGAGQLGGGADVSPVPENKPFAKTPTSEMEFDQALADLEKELGITIGDEPKVEESTKSKSGGTDGESKKRLEREGKFVKIINELDSTNRKSLKKVGELEVENDTVKSQMDYYKQQAQGYYEELRAQEFDRSKFSVADKAKNFVHYFNEYDADKENVQAKNAALREAVKIAGEITGRDLTPYLMDYFSQGTAVGMGELKGGTVPQSINVGPNKADGDVHKRNAIGNVLSKM